MYNDLPKCMYEQLINSSASGYVTVTMKTKMQRVKTF